jgi:hypothetical protein
MTLKYLINIYGEPVTKVQIKEMRAEIDGKLEDSLGYKVFWFTPIPGLDLLAGLATYAIEYGMKSEPRELLQNAKSSTLVDWSVTNASNDYVKKVRDSGRDLINLEVILLRKHIEMENAAKYVINEAGKAFSEKVGSIFKLNAG